MAVQGVSGVAKDLAKMSSKSAVKLLAPSAEGGLFRWVAYLTGSLRTAGFDDIHFIDAMTYHIGPEDLRARLMALQPDVIGTTAITHPRAQRLRDPRPLPAGRGRQADGPCRLLLHLTARPSDLRQFRLHHADGDPRRG